MKKSLTIEDLKSRIGKPVFVVCLLYNCKEWRILKNIGFGGVNTLEFTDDGVIEEELQGKFRFFDTEVVESELKEILESEAKEKSKNKTGYERVRKGEKYWNTRGDTFLDDDDFFNTLYLSGDYINNENLAKNIARAERLRYQLRRFAVLNGGIPSQEDWENKRIDKYYICYDYDDNKIDAYGASYLKEFGQVYFKNKQACKKAIEIFKDELLWYFTEFQEMLY